MEKEKNMLVYEQLRRVPREAIKTIAAGRLKGMSDINPMWRIKAMTQAFGPCGVGWRYEITRQWQETFGQETKAFTNINLYVKGIDGWSEPIPGTGGATLVEVNSRGSYVNDEGFKMALTDALSVAMKALGVAADVYFAKDIRYETKYEQQPQGSVTAQNVARQSIAADIIAEIGNASDVGQLKEIWDKHPELYDNADFKNAVTRRKHELTKTV